MNRIFCGDAPEVLRQLPSESVQMCVTSPPYYGLRNYGVDGQIGCEPSPLAYAERLVEVFREVRRVLRQDGTLWLNIGDCYAGSGKGIWSKPVSERPTKSYEHLFLLSKSPQYYYDNAAIMEPLAGSTVERNKRAVSEKNKYAGGLPGIGVQAIFKPRPCTQSSGMKNKRDVWSVSTNSYRADGYFAVFPERLIEPCVMAGSRVNDIVLDPFFGSGTTGAVCKRLGRRYIGIELNPEYCALEEKRIDEVKEENRWK